MKKLPDWEIYFDDFILKNQNKPFKWGSWDCCKFANACIKAMTGEDLIPKELKWKTEEEAMRSIKEYGQTLLKSLQKACAAKKLKSISKNYMTKGDLVVYKQESELVGICDGYSILSPCDTGICVNQDLKILKVWNINA